MLFLLDGSLECVGRVCDPSIKAEGDMKMQVVNNKQTKTLSITNAAGLNIEIDYKSASRTGLVHASNVKCSLPSSPHHNIECEGFLEFHTRLRLDAVQHPWFWIEVRPIMALLKAT